MVESECVDFCLRRSFLLAFRVRVRVRVFLMCVGVYVCVPTQLIYVSSSVLLSRFVGLATILGTAFDRKYH